MRKSSNFLNVLLHLEQQLDLQTLGSDSLYPMLEKSFAFWISVDPAAVKERHRAAGKAIISGHLATQMGSQTIEEGLFLSIKSYILIKY